MLLFLEHTQPLSHRKHYRLPPSAKSIRAFKINKMTMKKKRMAMMTKRMKMIKITRRITTMIEVVNVEDSDDDKEYINLETVGV